MAAKRTEPKTKPARKTTTRRRATTVTIEHDHIATRAYFIHLEGGGDAFENWLRAERELTTA